MTMRAILLAILFATIPMTVMAQTGNLEGRVVDGEGNPVASANVVVTSPSLTGTRSTLTSEQGFLSLVGLPVGLYRVAIRPAGLQELVVEEVRVPLGGTAFVGTLVAVPPQTEMEEVVVRSERLIDPESTEIDTNLSSELLASLPTERDYRSAIAFTPHANASYLGDDVNVAGATGQENTYIVDGVDVTDGFLHRAGTRLPQNFIREVEVKVGGYQAEYGRTAGGIINVITKTGSNEPERDLYAYFTSDNVASDSRRGLIDAEQASFARYDVGFGMGGPLVRDKLWYYAAYDPTIQTEELRIPGFDFYEDRTVIHQFAGKLTWQAAEDTRVNATVFGDPSRRDKVGPSNPFLGTPASLSNPDPLLANFESGGFSVSVDGQHLFGDRVVLEGKVSRHANTEKNEPATEIGRTEPLVMNVGTGHWEGGNGDVFEHRTTRRTVSLDATLFAGRHKVKVGTQYESTRLDEYWTLTLPSGESGWILQFTDTLFYSIAPFVRDGDVDHRVPTVYAQDSWAVTDRLRLNAGLRWDGLFIHDEDGQLQQAIRDQVQPRLGFVLQLGNDGNQRISGSVGRYFDSMATFNSAFRAGRGYQNFTRSSDPRVAPVDTLTHDVEFYENAPAVDGLKGEHHDEVTLRYDRRVTERWQLSLSGIHREQREIVEDALFDADGNRINIFGNPGRGELSYFPSPVRRYSALQLSVDYRRARTSVSGHYVLSRNYGNYAGAYNADQGVTNTNTGVSWDRLEAVSKGLLPNDRPHVFKIYGSHNFTSGLGVGGFFTWQTGTPLSEMYVPGSSAVWGFVGQRGSKGRTPSIWDLNLRFGYDLSRHLGFGGARSKILLDVFHVFSQRKPVAIEQLRYTSVDGDGNPINETSTYGQVRQYQPPMTFRLGVETVF